MKNRLNGNFYKNTLGTVFLLAGAFFVCSTLLSMRAVLADPIAPLPNSQNATDTRANSPRSGRASPRSNAKTRANATARPTTAPAANTSASRNISTRNVSPRVQPQKTTASRNVIARTATKGGTTRVSPTRSVRARSGKTSTARISLSGDAIRGAKGTTSSAYTYLNSKLYSGNYSNIIDSTTGLISADAYSNCLEAYYTCMDEICTARNTAQRRCACAGRVKSFAEAEDALQSANEELIKVSGQLALLIANKGKDISSAFTLTEAEQVMNCVSWKETTDKYGTGSADAKAWCYDHGIYDTNGTVSTITLADGKTRTGTFASSCAQPAYCSSGNNGNSFGFDVANMNGSSSDILASLASWADQVRENTNTILKNDNDSLTGAISTLTGVVSGLTGSSALSIAGEATKDSLAEMWGYDLYKYAHNNVCSRVLDSCFNGIYEACGTPPTDGRCANGANSNCPYNYNSKIEVNASGDVTLNERNASGTNSTASCFGYTSSSGDPYSSLRGPVADARRSVMQKYLLDANADCDLYGEQLKSAAQKIAYQKVAAQQALQQKRLEFYTAEQNTILNDAIAAGTNFNECISELWDCYETQATSNPSWPDARIKTYCAQIANVPHCYEDMICNPSYAQFRAIIDEADGSCVWNASDYTKNTCRNVVTLQEILRGTGAEPSEVPNPATIPESPSASQSSAGLREQCLREALGCDGTTTNRECIRNWTRPTTNTSTTSSSSTNPQTASSPGSYIGLQGGRGCDLDGCGCAHFFTLFCAGQSSFAQNFMQKT